MLPNRNLPQTITMYFQVAHLPNLAPGCVVENGKFQRRRVYSINIVSTSSRVQRRDGGGRSCRFGTQKINQNHLRAAKKVGMLKVKHGQSQSEHGTSSAPSLIRFPSQRTYPMRRGWCHPCSWFYSFVCDSRVQVKFTKHARIIRHAGWLNGNKSG